MNLGTISTLTLAAAFLAGLCVSASAASPIFAAKSLQLQNAVPSEADFNRPFEAPLPALVSGAEGKRLVNLANCSDYLAVRSNIVGSDTDANYRVVRLQTVPCVALTLLKSATCARHSSLPSNFLHSTATSNFPATLWPAVSKDERQRLSRQDATVRTASGKKVFRVVNGEALELEAANIGLRLTLLARGDFDHDGWEDAAFLWESYAIQGSYSDARLVVLTRTRADRMLRELLVEKLLPIK